MKNVFVLLFVLFAPTLLLTGEAVAQPKQMMRMDHQRFMDRERLLDQLNLTDEQKDKIEGLRLQHKKEMADLKAELEKGKISLEEIRNKDNFTRSEIIASVENINKIKDEIALKVANHRMDIYELLTDEQKEIWKENKHDFGMGGMGQKKMFQHKRFNDEW